MKKIDEMLRTLELWLEDSEQQSMHASVIAKLLKKIKKQDDERFFEYLKKIPTDILGDVLLELPEKIKDEAISHLSAEKLGFAVEALESDDATDLIQDIGDIDEEKSENVIASLDEEDQDDIEKLLQYSDNQAGAYMQTEVFDATLDESIENAVARLKTLKESDELENIHNVFIVDDDHHLMGAISLEDLITLDFSTTFQSILSSGDYQTQKARSIDLIEDVAHTFEQFDLNAIAIVDWENKLVGRITADDIIDVIEELATDQIYNMAGVDEDTEYEENLKMVTYRRGSWLFVNLLTAIAASFVISMFDETLQAFIPLAILMPIVASMGGNSGTQTLTVMVRQMALGDIDTENAKEAITKELIVSFFNGVLFAFIMGIVAFFWFDNVMLGVVIGFAMIINMLTAGIFGAIVPLSLKKFGIDPAIGSTVVLTTATDMIGFFAFLALAQAILL